ncbi:hypothetical protein C7I84_05220 [Mesorhizobium ephedrae]|uniref:Uncharacterized protein n=1 Tax=Kumtagia ephedrae TaxID=2116701 RepID=A0A2P7SPR4_9HYPH|nr:hypothetical protein C7I84_05220 [Mesorhizobium ephedrae]
MILAALSTLLVAGSAGAMERYDMASMSCAQIQTALKRDGKAILRSQSKKVPGLTLFNTYAGSRDQCTGGQAPTNRRVTAADGSCLVIQCVTPSHSWMRP